MITFVVSCALAVVFLTATIIAAIIFGFDEVWSVVSVASMAFNFALFSWITFEQGHKIKQWSPGTPSALVQEAPYQNKDYRRGELSK